MMKRSVFFCMGIISLLVTVSCGGKKVETAVVESPVAPIAVPAVPVSEKITATVTADSLRVRDAPYLDAQIVGHLMTGNRVLVESRTGWTEDIAGFDSPWFFIRADGYSGWTYGGFLSFGEVSGDSVPPDPGVVPPGENKNAPLEAPGVLNPRNLPEILLPVFGLENEIQIEKTSEGVITYNADQEKLVIPFSDSPESDLRTFVFGENSGENSDANADDNPGAPDSSNSRGRLHIVAESYGSQSYDRYYSLNDCELLPGVLLVDFFPLATLHAGSWEIYAFLNDNNWPAAVGKFDLIPADISLVPIPDPDPLRDSPRSHYSPGDTVYAFGHQDSGPGSLQVALYHVSDEYREGKILLLPVSAVQLQTDSSGFWSAEFILNASMPRGRYWAAVGSPIEGMENLILFFTGIYYGNIS
ncbi:MAG: hypothetical protein DRP70_05330 [Spirochaetes bacterium]|nr:MAG: hypothetical protein DRP60_10085 [Spirochaetota bacterium]RKX88913.1 MAG: hypothetical protein DRP70_05330 [Spirochaetota bacterium]RKX97880.1 MAG: hypothetical protein DRZ90_04830 [Spirochaetota bacterium]